MKKKVVTLVMAVIVSLSVFAGNNNNGNTKLTRAERRELREKEAIANAENMKAVLESQEWVLEADRLRDRYGNTGIVSSNINFVKVNGDHAVIQLGVTHDMGLNGVGGITVEGKVTKYEVKQGKKASSGFTLLMSVMGGPLGHSTVQFHISPNGNATATVSTIDGSRLTYDGKLIASSASRIYQGTTTY